MTRPNKFGNGFRTLVYEIIWPTVDFILDFDQGLDSLYLDVLIAALFSPGKVVQTSTEVFQVDSLSPDLVQLYNTNTSWLLLQDSLKAYSLSLKYLNHKLDQKWSSKNKYHM